MVNLNNYIIEKLIIGKNIIHKKEKIHPKDVSEMKLSWVTDANFQIMNITQHKSSFSNMVKFKKENKSINSIINRKYSKYTLLGKFLEAIVLEWDELIQGLKNKIIETKPFKDTENQIDVYIYDAWKHKKYYTISLWSVDTQQQILAHFTHYLNLYNISY